MRQVIDPPIRYLDSVSLGASFNGAPFKMRELDTVNFQIKWTGTATGSIKVEASNDPNFNWDQLPEGEEILVGVAGSVMFNYSQCGWLYTRLTWTRTGGTGTVDCMLTGNGTVTG